MGNKKRIKYFEYYILVQFEDGSTTTTYLEQLRPVEEKNMTEFTEEERAQFRIIYKQWKACKDWYKSVDYKIRDEILIQLSNLGNSCSLLLGILGPRLYPANQNEDDCGCEPRDWENEIMSNVYITTDEIKYCAFPGCGKMAHHITLAADDHPLGMNRPRVWTCGAHVKEGESLLEKKIQDLSNR